ncbi:MAG: PAS domain S-box protein, partial [Gammaproteobacteria bacterium]|nr:PAS domain S-box protein [Gammaproteobacteria bacterium]
MNKSIEDTQSSSSDYHESAVLAEQTSQLYAAVNFAIIGTFINASILVFVMWSVIDHDTLLIWLIAIVLISLARGITAHQYKKAAPPIENSRFWIQRFLIGSVLISLVWGASTIWLFPVDDVARQVFLAFVVGGMTAAAVSALSQSKVAIYSYLGFILIPLLAQFFYSGTELGIAMGTMVTLYFFWQMIVATRTHENIKENISLRIESVERERILEQSEHRYKTLLETATDAFFLHDLQGRFLDVNEQACFSLGYTRDELLNMSVSDIEVGTNPRELKQLWPKLEKRENIHIEGIQRRKDGSTFPVEVSMGLIQMDNEYLIS